MAASSSSYASKEYLPLETALLQLQSAFQSNGFHGIPVGLETLLRTYSHEGGRKALYKRLYGILWYGSGKLLGARDDGRNPTYVYPSALKAVVRVRFPDDVKDWQDPVGSQVYTLTYKDLWEAKWPATKTSKASKWQSK